MTTDPAEAAIAKLEAASSILHQHQSQWRRDGHAIEEDYQNDKVPGLVADHFTSDLDAGAVILLRNAALALIAIARATYAHDASGELHCCKTLSVPGPCRPDNACEACGVRFAIAALVAAVTP